MTEEQVRFKVGADSELPVVLNQLDKLIQAQADLGSQGDKMSKKMQDAYRTQSLAIRDLTDTIQENYKAAQKSGDGQSELVKRQNQQFDGLGNTIKSVRNQLVAAFGISELKEHIEKIFELTATWQKYTAALTVSLGSQKKASDALNMLQKYADVTNFTLDELADTFTKFANRGMVLGTENMVRLGDVANALQKPFKDLGEAILDINNTERWNELGIKAKTNGDKVSLTFKGVTLEVDRTEQGVLRAITAFGALNGVQGQTALQAQQLGGQYSTLKDNIDGLYRSIGEELTPTFMEAIKTGIELTGTIKEQSKQGGLLNAIWGTIRDTGTQLWSMMTELVTPVRELAIRWFPVLFGITGDTAGVMKVLASAINIGVIGPFKAMILIVREGWQALQGFYNGMQGIAIGFKGVQAALTGDLAGMGQAFALSKEYFDKAGKNFTNMKDIYLKTNDEFIKSQKAIWDSGKVTLEKVNNTNLSLVEAEKKRWIEEGAAFTKGSQDYKDAYSLHLKALEDAAKKDKAIALENEKWAAISKNLKAGSAEYVKAYEKHLTELDKAKGVYLSSDLAKDKDANDKKKKAAAVSANEIQQIQLETLEKTYENQLKIIDNNAQVEIDKINKQVQNKKIAHEQGEKLIQAVLQKAANDRLGVEAEHNGKIEALTKKLQDSVAEINLKAGKEVIKINAETVKKIVDGKMELGDYEKIIATERLKIEKDLAEKVEKIHEDTAKIIKATREGEIKFAQEALEKFVGQHSQIGGAALKAWDDYKNSVTATAEATQSVNAAQANLNALVNSGTASVIDIANAEKDLTKARQEQSKAGIEAAQMNLNLASTIANVAEAIKNSLVEEVIKAYNLMSEAIARTRQVVVEFYSTAIALNQESLAMELEDFTGTWEEKERIMTAYFNRERELMGARDRADAEMAFQQNVLAITSDTTAKIAGAWDISKGPLGPKALLNVLMSFKEHNAQLNAAAYEREAYEEQLRQQRIQQEIDAARQIRDAKLESLAQEMAAFEESKRKEMEIVNAVSDDKNMRLQGDDVYRAKLLAEGEAREIAALQAARDRELQRAVESGATAEELAQIKLGFENLITETHIKYQDVMYNKDEAIKLAQKQLEAQTTAQINALKDEVAAKDAQVNDAMTFENQKYRNFVIESNRAMLESQKAMAIAQLRAEIAILKGKRNIFNSGRINAAIGDIEGAIRELEGVGATPVELGDAFADRIKSGFIAQNKNNKTPFNSDTMQAVTEAFDRSGNVITLTYTDEDREFVAYDKSGNAFKLRNAYGLAEKTGEKFFKGSEWVDGIGYPEGIDTVPAWLTKGERVLPTSLNEKLGPQVSNEELVKSYLKLDELKQKFGSVRIEEFGLLNFDTGNRVGNVMDVRVLEKKMDELIDVINSKPGYQINVDANHITVGEIGRNEQHITYYEDIYNR